MHVHQAAARGSDPEASIAIAKHRPNVKLPRGCGEAGEQLQMTIDEAINGASFSHQERPIVAFGQSVKAAVAGYRKKSARVGAPSPDTIVSPDPDGLLAVPVCASHHRAMNRISSLKRETGCSNVADSGFGIGPPRGRYFAGAILDQGENRLSVKLVVLANSGTAFLHTDKTSRRADPKSAIPSRHQS